MRILSNILVILIAASLCFANECIKEDEVPPVGSTFVTPTEAHVSGVVLNDTEHDTNIIVKGNHKLFRKVSSKELEHMKEEEAHKHNFPTVSTPIPWGLPVEVQIIGTLPKGVGTMMYNMVTKEQSEHPEYILEFNEGSAKIMNTNFELQDATAVYTFSVDKEDLVFHRHEGHRCITGMSGSGGALMKFSTVDNYTAKADPQAFVDNMFIVEIPADSIFVLRFNGMVYHQFGPRDPSIPAFWAVSVHTNEKGGYLAPELLEKVLKGEGNIPLLTEPIPDEVDNLLKTPGVLETVKRYSLPSF